MEKPVYKLGNMGDQTLWDDADWEKFAQFWEGLPLDGHMGDGGTYRRRKYSAITYNSENGTVRVVDDEGFHQSKEINKLNGGIVRRFEPIDQGLLDSEVFRKLLSHFSTRIAEAAPADEPAPALRRINIHQHRIAATGSEAGNPTPEGIHRDGVEHVVMMMIGREDVIGGESTLYDNGKSPFLTHTLADPGDYIFLDDRTCMHSVTPVQVAPQAKEGRRDMFFLEFC